MTEETLMDCIDTYLNTCYRAYGELTDREEAIFSNIRFKLMEWFEEQVQELEKKSGDLLKVLEKLDQHKINMSEPTHKIMERDILRNSTRNKLKESLGAQVWLKRKIPKEGE